MVMSPASKRPAALNGRPGHQLPASLSSSLSVSNEAARHPQVADGEPTAHGSELVVGLRVKG